MEAYKVVKQIGRGNFGAVYLVESLETGEPLCLKKISFFGMSDSEKDAAKQEVALLSSLRHPCIVRYVDSFIQDSTLHIVMQMCEGGDLATRIKAAKRAKMYFEEGQILDWLCQLAFAVAYIHKRRVLHRDLKTQNVFLTSNNLVRLGDFGIARVLEHTFENARTVVGTPYYMSPEVCENKDYNAASDMWALGCVLYEMCTLQHAFSANNLLGLVYKIVQEAHPPIPAHYTDDMRNLVNAMLSKNPNERYEAEEILELPFVKARLEKLALQLEGTTAGAKTPAMRPKKPINNSSNSNNDITSTISANNDSNSNIGTVDDLSPSSPVASSSPEGVAAAAAIRPVVPDSSLPAASLAIHSGNVDVIDKPPIQGDSVKSSLSSLIPSPQFDNANAAVANTTSSTSNSMESTSTVQKVSTDITSPTTSAPIVIAASHHGLPLSPSTSPVKQSANGTSPVISSTSAVGISLSPISGGKAPRSRRPSSLLSSPQPVQTSSSSPLAPLSPQPVMYSSPSSSSSSSSLFAPLTTSSRRGSGIPTPMLGLLSPPSHLSNNGLAPLQLAGYKDNGGIAAGSSSSSRSLDTAGSSSSINTTDRADRGGDRNGGGFLSPGWAPTSTPNVSSLASPYSQYSQVGSNSSRNSNGSGSEGGGGGGGGVSGGRLYQNDAFQLDRQRRSSIEASSTSSSVLHGQSTTPQMKNGNMTPLSSRRPSAISSIVSAARLETAIADAAQDSASSMINMTNNQRRPSLLFSSAMSPPPYSSTSSSSLPGGTPFFSYQSSDSSTSRRPSATGNAISNSSNNLGGGGGGSVVNKLNGAISAGRELINQDVSSSSITATENHQQLLTSPNRLDSLRRPSSTSLPQILPPITSSGGGGGGGGRRVSTSTSSRVSSAASDRKKLIYKNNTGIAGDDDPSDRWQGEEDAEREAAAEAEKRRRRKMIEKRRSSKIIHNLHTDDEGNAIMAFGREDSGGEEDNDIETHDLLDNEVDNAHNIDDIDENGYKNQTAQNPHHLSRPVSTGSGYLSDGFSDDGFEDNLDVDAIHKNRVATEEVENIMAILAEDEHSLHTLQAIAQVYLKQGDGGETPITGRSSVLPRRSSSRAGTVSTEPSSSGLRTPTRPPARSASSARLTDDPTVLQTPTSSTRDSRVNTPMPLAPISSSSTTVPAMSGTSPSITQKRSLDATPKKSQNTGGGGGLLSPDTFQKIKHTYLDTPTTSATPVVVSSHTSMQRAPSYFSASQQQDASSSAADANIASSKPVGGATSAVYSRAHVDALRAKCRASLGPAVFQSVEAFLREQRATTSGAQVVLSQNKIRRSLLAIVLDKNLLPFCSQVAEMLHMESVVLSNELRSS
jgi:serine/threonine protein kinase